MEKVIIKDNIGGDYVAFVEEVEIKSSKYSVNINDYVISTKYNIGGDDVASF